MEKLKLSLAGGTTPPEGFLSVDLFAPDPWLRTNLLDFPWPIDDDSCSNLHCSHFIEHIPMTYVSTDPQNTHPDVSSVVPRNRFDRDLLCVFFDECWRVLEPGGRIELVWPALQSVRAFQDPTHRRFIPVETLHYLSAEWRKMQGLDHYLCRCNFSMVQVGLRESQMFAEHHALHSNEATQQAMVRNWNMVDDYQAVLAAVKG